MKKVKGHSSASNRDGSYGIKDIKQEQGQNNNLTLVLNKTSEFNNTISGEKETPCSMFAFRTEKKLDYQ